MRRAGLVGANLSRPVAADRFQIEIQPDPHQFGVHGIVYLSVVPWEEHDMTDKSIDWTPDLTLPTSKSTVQHFSATAGGDRLTIDTTPWGEADLTVNGQSIAHIDVAPSAGDAFRTLETFAEDFEAGKNARDRQRPDHWIDDDEVREKLGLKRSL